MGATVALRERVCQSIIGDGYERKAFVMTARKKQSRHATTRRRSGGSGLTCESESRQFFCTMLDFSRDPCICSAPTLPAQTGDPTKSCVGSTWTARIESEGSAGTHQSNRLFGRNLRAR